MSENNPPESSENIRVVVRCRPPSKDELDAKQSIIVQLNSVQQTVALKDPSSDSIKAFTFDNVFPADSKQPDIFNQVARPIVDNVLEGFNGTIFAYGQTGSGKTFTMEGVPERPELRGIIPNAFAHIFGHIAKAEGYQKFLVRASYFEIYKEQIRDLLVKKSDKDRGVGNNLEVKEDREKGVYIKGLNEQVVHSADDLEKVLLLGKKSRVTAATKMNEQSSRSHAIFSITIERSERRPDGRLHICVGKLNLVDLAGSERQSKTEATDERLKEASKINHGLSTLGNVIAALTDGKSQHIPYRNSKLTRILQDSLGGNSKTVMCANIGPASYNFDETANTLRYATRAKWIKNAAKINEDPKDAVLKRLEEEIQALRQQLSGAPDEDAENEEDEKLRDERRIRRETRRQHLLQMQEEINAKREELERNRSLDEKEREKLRKEIARKEDELESADKERHALQEKLKLLEKTIIVGGENLLDKAEEQERLLEESARELQERRKKEDELRKTLLHKKTERTQMEEKFVTLQEIAAAKNFEAARLKGEISSLKNDLKVIREENARRKEESKLSIRETEKNIKLYKKIIDRFLPKEMQNLIEANCVYNKDIGEWEVSCLAFTGAMMQPEPTGKSRSGHSATGAPLNYAEALAQAEQRRQQQYMDNKWELCFKSYADEI
ncbi:kinesin-like protein KIF3A [Paramacrobiotus metropolitanus]|uniref:kinesin-like protein KIF3A n=1 Tax=Paramacrobiotus metropolitanus TaxID=2943436 RepID=UPI002445AD98|nr:kinesin-like protein KIF3A [Paramacrobiotus metropolitanus]